jgi:hypothetical protein
MFLFTSGGMTIDTLGQSLSNVALQNEVGTTTDTTAGVIILPKEELENKKEDKKEGAEGSVLKPGASLTVEQKVKTYFSKTPVLARIAKCESTFRQHDKNGNVLRGKVNSRDVGVMQINERYHSAKAKSLGLNLHTLEGNMRYAEILYKEQGTSPWKASSHCWGGNSIIKNTEANVALSAQIQSQSILMASTTVIATEGSESIITE